MYFSFILPFFIKFALPRSTTPPQLKVAFAGDFGLPSQNQYSNYTFDLIRTERADFTVLLGDYSYMEASDEFPDAGISDFINLLDDILGIEHPVFPVAGNHDDQYWWQQEDDGDEFDGYRKRFWDRLMQQNLDELSCTPNDGTDFGVASSCDYKGIHMILSGAGTEEPQRPVDHIDFVDEMFSETESLWRVCAFHEVMRLFQVGDENDGMESYDIYERCRKAGAIIASAHEHSYARTKNMAKYDAIPQYLNISGSSAFSPLLLDYDLNVAFVAGTGGKDLRECVDVAMTNEWWASALCADSEPDPISFGAVFCEFNIVGDSKLARCYFKEVPTNNERSPPQIGKVRDSFYIRSMFPEGRASGAQTSSQRQYDDVVVSTPNEFSGTHVITGKTNVPGESQTPSNDGKSGPVSESGSVVQSGLGSILTVGPLEEPDDQFEDSDSSQTQVDQDQHESQSTGPRDLYAGEDVRDENQLEGSDVLQAEQEDRTANAGDVSVVRQTDDSRSTGVDI